MKFFADILAFLFDVLQAVHGHFWLPGSGALTCVVALSNIGCQSAAHPY